MRDNMGMVNDNDGSDTFGVKPCALSVMRKGGTVWLSLIEEEFAYPANNNALTDWCTRTRRTPWHTTVMKN
uniref:Transposase n=1 Tax=Steinernema glaseri TaxID=37863 RepID=A0A1I7YSS6_9BILA